MSVPGDKTPQESWEKLFKQVQPLSNGTYKFNIPSLKVGTLDQLFGLSDDLNKLDSFVEMYVVDQAKATSLSHGVSSLVF